MRRKNISLSGDVYLGLLPKGIVDFSRHDVFIYLDKDQKCLGILVEEGKNEFFDVVQNGDFIPFQDGLCFSLKDGGLRVVLFRVKNRLKIKKIERRY